MKKFLYLIMFKSDDQLGDGGYVVVQTSVSDATVEMQAIKQNELSESGSTRTLLAMTVPSWQRWLLQTLAIGFASGVILSGCTVGAFLIA